jgi:glycosyltransferase involved in cell wall biosynthesis
VSTWLTSIAEFERGAAEVCRPVRVVLQQPSLAKYRVPVFRELASRPGIELRVVHAELPQLPNVEPHGFEAELVPMWRSWIFGRPVYWSRAQWDQATLARADVVIMTWDLHYMSLIPALVRARTSGVKTILWGHGYSKNERAWRAWPRRNVGRLADALLFYNYAVADQFVRGGFDSRRVFVAINSVDQAPIRAAREHWLRHPEGLAAFRRAHALGPGPVLLFVSRLDPVNRVDLLLHAVSSLASRYPSLKAVLVGTGEPEGACLRRLAVELGIAERIVFAGAIYDEAALAPWFLCADLFCYPANIGLSLLHSFGYGLPVVTSDRTESQNPEIEALQDGINGLTYRHDDRQSLARALARVLDDRALRQHLAAGALATVRERFTVPRMVDGMERAIRFVVNQAW